MTLAREILASNLWSEPVIPEYHCREAEARSKDDFKGRHFGRRRLNGSQDLKGGAVGFSGVNRQCDFTPGGDGLGAELAMIGGGEMFRNRPIATAEILL
ncbi:hypothetical protein [Rhizobium laguerreae]|uniref:hypothetical protein n=1 Tax=Rhizobium laguerreae TaxID=1076926 RepID=UPI003704A39A